MIDQRFTNRFFLLAIVFCVSILNAGKSFAQDVSREVVGEITTAIGQSMVRNSSGDYPTSRGQHIHAGDSIETAEGGHVHIRFVDGGLVSVRPLSRLLVEEYRNISGSSLAAIKFRLEEGVIRSVTGQWGEASRDRFRLNTPIAAIGIKGTDFVVKVEQGKTFASVISGAITMAPLEGICASSLGPCQNENATLLSAEMRGKMLEYLQKNGVGGPRLVPLVDLMARNSVNLPQNETRRSEVIIAAAATTTDKVLNIDPQASGALVDSVPHKPQPQPQPPNEPVTPSNPQLLSKPLIWLHNVLGWNVPDYTISERYSAEIAAGRTPVIGDFFINLYRDETLQATFQPPLSSVSFNLTNASANFTQPVAYDRPVEPVQISSAALNVDFARATFATQMNLSSPSLGKDQLQAAGTISPTGVFLANSTTQSLAGAFSMDGKQAGYFFNKSVTGGKVSGLTLWGH